MIYNKGNLDGKEETNVDGATMIVQSHLKAWAAIWACFITLSTIILKSFLPDTQDYTMGFAPAGITAHVLSVVKVRR
ncbi:hypothetical protein ACFFIX_27105 [Metabacillus herbersteinensis]|uniref:Uncharacterized protein n=1 Tax=Metabacillus herbersteinensis TaxID=283816 RepID=A0ABV6GMQ8_9BACI